MKRFLAAVITALCAIEPLGVHAADPGSPTQTLMSKLQWRSIGAYIGGRVVAIAPGTYAAVLNYGGQKLRQSLPAAKAICCTRSFYATTSRSR